MVDYHPTHEVVRSEDDSPEELRTECRWCGIEGNRVEVADPCPYKGPRDYPSPSDDLGMPAFVSDLRGLADRLAAHPEPDGLVYFPPAESGEGQPVPLVGHVRVALVADLLHYVADMLEP